MPKPTLHTTWPWLMSFAMLAGCGLRDPPKRFDPEKKQLPKLTLPKLSGESLPPVPLDSTPGNNVALEEGPLKFDPLNANASSPSPTNPLDLVAGLSFTPPNDDLLSQLPEDKPLAPPQERDMMERHLAQGVELFNQQRFAEAIRELQLGVDAYPHDFRPYVFIGLSQMQMGQFAEALGNFNLSMRLNDQVGIVYLHRANVYLRLHDPSRAEADFTRAIELGLEGPQVYGGRATAHLNLRRFQQAARDATRAIEAAPNDAEAHLLRALALLFDRKREQGAVDFERAKQLGLDPRAVEFWSKNFYPPED